MYHPQPQTAAGTTAAAAAATVVYYHQPQPPSTNNANNANAAVRRIAVPKAPTRVYETSARLLGGPHRPGELPPVERGPRLTHEKEELMVDRLYAQDLRRRNENRDRLVATLLLLPPTTTTDKKQQQQQQGGNAAAAALTTEETEQLTRRLYQESVEATRMLMKRLEKKYVTDSTTVVGTAGTATSGLGRMTQEEQQESVNRVYYGRRQYRKEIYDRLYDKYVVQTEPRFPHLPKARLELNAKRLHQNESRAAPS
eukprot:TRINITY_DN9504_c0_g1_i2.p1 TRINITY_DN9504_c0_g1~~TRINITY_DN9504_c0_g1_i2.p1  ORF type:complete len:255 (-),score=57.07 TRINITY_DN9504_c0_g1_i2:304-1068(-)